MSLTVRWGKERYGNHSSLFDPDFINCARLHITLPSPDPKLGAIRQTLVDYSHVPAENIKLIFGGGIMKDDNYPRMSGVRQNEWMAGVHLPCVVSAYGIGDGSTLHMVGVADLPPARNAPAPSKEAPQRATEPELISKIQDELQQTRQSLVPPLDAFLRILDSLTPPPTSELEREHIRLGELLLQSLLRLDALMPEGNWEDARTLRKGAVREVQSLLDRLDDAWKTRKISLVK